MSKTYVLDKFIGGRSDYQNKGIKGAFKEGTNLDIRGDIDSIKGNQALTDDLAAGTMSSLAKFIVPAADGSSYHFTDDEIYERDSGGNYTLAHTDPDGGIRGAAQWSNGEGDIFIYWATATKLHRKRIIGISYTNVNWTDTDDTVNGATYPKTNLEDTTWHTMGVTNGVLLGANLDKLFQVAFDDSYTNEILQLIPGDEVKSLLERSDYALIGTENASGADRTHMYVWDQLSLSWNNKKAVSENPVNAMIDTEIPIMQVGSNGLLMFGDLTSTLPLTSFSGGGQVNPDGVAVDDGMALFGVFGNGTGKTGIWSYGRKMKNAPFCLNLEYQFDCDEIGSVKKIGNEIIFSYKNGANYGVKKVDLTAKADWIYESLDLRVPLGIQKEAEFAFIKLQTAGLPASTSIQVWRRVNKTGAFVQCNLEGSATAFDTDDAEEAVFLVGDKGKVIEVQIKGFSNANVTPEVFKVDVIFND